MNGFTPFGNGRSQRPASAFMRIEPAGDLERPSAVDVAAQRKARIARARPEVLTYVFACRAYGDVMVRHLGDFYVDRLVVQLGRTRDRMRPAERQEFVSETAPAAARGAQELAAALGAMGTGDWLACGVWFMCTRPHLPEPLVEPGKRAVRPLLRVFRDHGFDLKPENHSPFSERWVGTETDRWGYPLVHPVQTAFLAVLPAARAVLGFAFDLTDNQLWG